MLTPFKQKLRTEIDAWLAEQLISPEQAQKLHQRYELDAPAPWYLRSGFILSGVALVLVGMGFFLLISANWEHLPLWARVLTGALPMAVAYAVGFYAEWREKTDTAELAFFFGSLTLGLNIYLQAQIFHIEAYYPNGVMWWFIGAAPLAWYYRSQLHLTLLLVLFPIWISMQLGNAQFTWVSVPMFAYMAYLLWRHHGGAQLLLLGLSWCLWLWDMYFAFVPKPDARGVFIFVVANFLSLLLALPWIVNTHHERIVGFMRQVAALGVLIPLFMLTYSDVATDIFEHLPQANSMVYSALLIVATGAVSLWKIRYDGTTLWLVGIAALLWIGAVCLHQSQAFTVMVLANVLLLVHAIWRIFSGIQARVKAQFMYGVLLLLILAIARYLSFADNYIAGALIFMASGVGLWLINRFWNNRYQS